MSVEYHAIEIHDPRTERRSTAERKQPFGQPRCARTPVLNGFDKPATGIRRLQLLVQQVGVPRDDCQEVVEIVGNASGELSRRLHLLRLTKLLFELYSIGDVCDAAAYERARRIGEADQPDFARKIPPIRPAMYPLEHRRAAADGLLDVGSRRRPRLAAIGLQRRT